jgi:hypothetical protein
MVTKKPHTFYVYSVPRNVEGAAWQLIGEGVVFTGGKVVVYWRGEVADIETYLSMIDAYNGITGYNAAQWDTRLIWTENVSYFSFIENEFRWDRDPLPAGNRWISRLEVYEPSPFVRASEP